MVVIIPKVMIISTMMAIYIYPLPEYNTNSFFMEWLLNGFRMTFQGKNKESFSSLTWSLLVTVSRKSCVFELPLFDLLQYNYYCLLLEGINRHNVFFTLKSVLIYKNIHGYQAIHVYQVISKQVKISN